MEFRISNSGICRKHRPSETECNTSNKGGIPMNETDLNFSAKLKREENFNEIDEAMLTAEGD